MRKSIVVQNKILHAEKESHRKRNENRNVNYENMPQLIFNNSTSNLRIELGGIIGGNPLAPYAYQYGCLATERKVRIHDKHNRVWQLIRPSLLLTVEEHL